MFSYCTHIAFSLIVILQFLGIRTTTCHRTDGYSHETSIPLDNSRWMSLLPDDALLSSLSLPGTHETLSRGYGGEIAECHTLSLESQLKAGIRVLDIRCRHIENSFAIHHGMVFMHLMFGDVLQKLEIFLKENPTETVLMRVKEEYSPANFTLTFEETFKSYYDGNPTLFWHTGNPTDESPNPKLGSVRGKVVILDNFSSTTKYGINYGDPNQIVVQDDFKFTTNWDLYWKWEKVKEQLRNADVSRRAGENKFFFNYLSGSYGALPYFVASGHITPGSDAHRLSTGFTTLMSRNKYPDFPRLDCVLKICTIAFEGTNVLAMQFLRVRRDMLFVGVIMADFPGDGLISTIISTNARKLDETFVSPLWTIILVALASTVFCVALIFSIITVLRVHKKKQQSVIVQKHYKVDNIYKTKMKYDRF